MNNQPILLNVANSIAHCILNNPPKNEMNALFFNELTRLRKEVFPTLSVKGMLVYGKGRHFSSGANIADLMALYHERTSEEPAPFLHENIETFLALESLPFPVVAIINGCCLGAGLELALSCHYRIASRHAVFSLPESTYGLIPGCGGTIRLPGLIKKGKAIEMILTGRIIPADEALEIGLVNSVTEKKNCMHEAEMIIAQHTSFNESQLPSPESGSNNG